MVRFIISRGIGKLWFEEKNLHSNMVRFIIFTILVVSISNEVFTFQYG